MPSVAAFDPKNCREGPWSLTTANTATATAATATLTYPGLTDGRQCRGVYGFLWSYSGGAPTGGNIQVLDGATVVLDQDITADDMVLGAQDEIFFPAPYIALPGNDLSAVLASGGSGVVGKLSGIAPFVAQSYPAYAIPDLDFSNPDNSGFIPVVL